MGGLGQLYLTPEIGKTLQSAERAANQFKYSDISTCTPAHSLLPMAVMTWLLF